MTKTYIEIKIVGECVTTGVNLRHFPKIYRDFLISSMAVQCVNTLKLEKEGKSLMKASFAKHNRVHDFFLEVVEWGSPSCYLVLGQLKKNYGKKYRGKIVRAIRAAIYQLKNKHISKDDRIKNAISKIIKLDGVNVSFASKVLRMLSPEKTGAYDSVLKKHFGYPYDANGFVKFCNDLKAVTTELNYRRIKKQNGGKWRIADVEAVLYHLMY